MLRKGGEEKREGEMTYDVTFHGQAQKKKKDGNRARPFRLVDRGRQSGKGEKKVGKRGKGGEGLLSLPLTFTEGGGTGGHSSLRRGRETDQKKGGGGKKAGRKHAAAMWRSGCGRRAGGSLAVHYYREEREERETAFWSQGKN